MSQAIQDNDVRDENNGAEAALDRRLTATFIDRYRELLDGVPAGEPTWVTTGGPEGGINGTLATLSAEQASRDLGGSTIAAHAEHVRWALQLVNDYFAGVNPTGDWSESWLVTTVDGPAWDDLRAKLKVTGDGLLANLRDLQHWSDDMSINGAIASYGHTAYHLGALRQMQKRVNGADYE